MDTWLCSRLADGGLLEHDDVLSSLQGQPDADINAGNSNVEIRLASSAGGTRSSVESTADGLFEADGLGIFCLAKGVQGVNPAERPIVWNGYDELDFSVWMDNIETNAEFNADTTATSSTGWTARSVSIRWPTGIHTVSTATIPVWKQSTNRNRV